MNKTEKRAFWYLIPFLTYLYHHRCEAFSTYPRTYDLLHAWTVFSDLEKRGCSAEDLLIEINRILRPTGFIIIRDKPVVVDLVRKYLSALKWESIAAVDPEPNSDSDDNESVLVVRKLWPQHGNLKDLA
jgi:Putative S-adenosyl-L-methionine-dependent methyltransferase